MFARTRRSAVLAAIFSAAVVPVVASSASNASAGDALFPTVTQAVMPASTGSLRITGGVWYLPPGRIFQAPNATVTARRTSDGRTVSTRTDSRGSYSLQLTGGTWVISAQGSYNGRNYSGVCASRAIVSSTRVGSAGGFNINMAPR